MKFLSFPSRKAGWASGTRKEQLEKLEELQEWLQLIEAEEGTCFKIFADAESSWKNQPAPKEIILVAFIFKKQELGQRVRVGTLMEIPVLNWRGAMLENIWF